MMGLWMDWRDREVVVGQDRRERRNGGFVEEVGGSFGFVLVGRTLDRGGFLWRKVRSVEKWKGKGRT